MVDIDIETRVLKLNPIALTAFMSALKQAKVAGNRHMELAHWLNEIFKDQSNDIVLTADYFGLDVGALKAKLESITEGFAKNVTEQPQVSEAVVDCLDRGWHYATLLFGEMQMRTGHILIAALKDRALSRDFLSISRDFGKIKVDELAEHYRKIWAPSDEERVAAPAPAARGPAPAAGGRPAAPGGARSPDSALAKYASNLTARAATGEDEPIIGRDDEIRQIIDVLMRRRQNNPILVGEAGVGKTAVVEGFAQKIAAGAVPPKLQGVEVHSLDVGLLQAGASMKGEFEQRLRSVIDEVQNSPTPIILFVDEAHTLIGAGGQAGTGDAANLLKPALARGTLRTVAATTWSEYRQYIEKDPALTRRFQPIQVGEPSVEQCVDMLRGIVDSMERHHGVKISDKALVAAVQLSERYIPARQLPDKAVSLLDTAAARVAISQNAVPAAVADIRARIAARTKEKEVLAAERALGTADEARIAEIEEQIAASEAELAALEAGWAEERELVESIAALRAKLASAGPTPPAPGATAGAAAGAASIDAASSAPAGGAASPTAAGGDVWSLDHEDQSLPLHDGDDAAGEWAAPRPVGAPAEIGAATATASTAPVGAGVAPDAAAAAGAAAAGEAAQDLVAELRARVARLEAIDRDRRMMYAHVDEHAVAAVVADWTGIPVGRMVRDEVDAVLNLPEVLNRRVIGQSHALSMIARRIETNRARLDNPNKPIGVFMLCGPSGVGKTETALALAEAIYGGEQNMITINMSEFQEAHSVATLKGAPPGYVGYGEGGRLTEAVRRRPYSVVLLDEVEKAHPDVHEIFFQVFDKGEMEDGTGRHINFKNTLIILTTNVGTDVIMDAVQSAAEIDPNELAVAMRPALLEVFPPALLGRIVAIPYYPLSTEMLDNIVRLQLGRVAKRLRDNHKAVFEYGDDLVEHIVRQCDDPNTGGRMIDNIVTNSLLPLLSREILGAYLEQREFAHARVKVADGGLAVELV